MILRDTVNGDCQHCGRHTEGYLCSRCLGILVKALGELPALLHDLETVVTRQDRVSSTAPNVYGRQGADQALAEYRLIPARLRSTQGRIALPATPWAYGADAAVLLREVRASLKRWIGHLVESGVTWDAADRVLGPVHRWVEINATKGPIRPCEHASCITIIEQDNPLSDRRGCVWLIEHRADVARFDNAGEMMARLLYESKRVTDAIDRRDPDVFLGKCDAEAIVCGAELYARLEDKEITCPVCGWAYTVAVRKARLLERVYDEHRPIRQVADAVTCLLTDDRHEPVECTESMVRNYIDRGRLATKGTDQQKRLLVRVGDVVELLEAKMERDRLRRAKPRKVSA